MAIVAVHGVAQQASDPAAQLKLWSDAIHIGVRNAGYPVESVPAIVVPFYGWLFRKGSAYLGDEDGDAWTTEEQDFVAETIEEGLGGELQERLSRDDCYELGPPAIFPPLLQRLAFAVDRRWGRGSGRLLFGNLRQAHAYLTNERTSDLVREIVAAQIDVNARVLIGHSLGSVISYDLLMRGEAGRVSHLVTVGSPLGWPTVGRALSHRLPSTPIARQITWHNIFDAWDVVTAGRGLDPEAVDHPVDNGWRDPHSLVRYLGQASCIKSIMEGLG